MHKSNEKLKFMANLGNGEYIYMAGEGPISRSEGQSIKDKEDEKVIEASSSI